MRLLTAKSTKSTKIFFLLFVSFALFVVCSLSVRAQSSAADDQSDSPPPKPPSRWQFSLSIINRTGFRLNDPRVFQMSRNIVKGKGIYKFSDNWRLTAEGNFHYDPVERLGYPKRPSFDLRQLLIDGKYKRVRFSLGLQQTVWGQADGLRVLDVINPLDYREFILEDFLDSRRPLWTVRADVPVENGKGSLQFIFVPYFAPGRLPGANDEFGFGESFGLGTILADTPLASVPIAVEPVKRPGYRISSSQFGVRYSRSVGNWDLTANFFRGWEDIATPKAGSFQIDPPKLTIAPKYERKTVFGGTAATNFGPVVLRLEAGWSFRKPTAVTVPSSNGFEKLDQFSSVVGLDYSPRPWISLSGQYFLQFASAPSRDLLFPRYEHLTSFYVKTNFLRDTLKPEIFILTGLNRRQYLIRPKIVKNIGDHFIIGAGTDLLGGRRTTPFGFFKSRDRFVIELRWLK